jgi:hypothetical protein
LAAVVRLGRHLRHTKDEVPDLPKELILVDIPVEQSPAVSIHQWLLMATFAEFKISLPIGTVPVSAMMVMSARLHTFCCHVELDLPSQYIRICIYHRNARETLAA